MKGSPQAMYVGLMSADMLGASNGQCGAAYDMTPPVSPNTSALTYTFRVDRQKLCVELLLGDSVISEIRGRDGGRVNVNANVSVVYCRVWRERIEEIDECAPLIIVIPPCQAVDVTLVPAPEL
jgi:hypothetical protein